MINNYQEAENNFRKVIELAPNLDEGYLNLGLLYRLKGNEADANHYLRKALSINPNNKKIESYISR